MRDGAYVSSFQRERRERSVVKKLEVAGEIGEISGRWLVNYIDAIFLGISFGEIWAYGIGNHLSLFPITHVLEQLFQNYKINTEPATSMHLRVKVEKNF